MPKYQDKVILKKASPILTEEKPAEETTAERRLSSDPDETAIGYKQGDLGVASESNAQTEPNEGFPIVKPAPSAGSSSARFSESRNISRHRYKEQSIFQPVAFCVMFLVASFGLAKGAFLPLTYLRTDLLIQAASNPSTKRMVELLDPELYRSCEMVQSEADKTRQLAETYFYVADRLPNPSAFNNSIETQESKKNYFQKSISLLEKYRARKETLAELKALKLESSISERNSSHQSNYRKITAALITELELGDAKGFLTDNQGALLHYENALELFRIKDSESGMAMIYNRIGNCKYNMHDYRGAIQAFETEKILRERDLPKSVSALKELKVMIAKCYFKLADYDKAERILKSTDFENDAHSLEKQRLEILKRIDKSKRKG